MTVERWREVEQVYQSTTELDARSRAAFLSDACNRQFKQEKNIVF